MGNCMGQCLPRSNNIRQNSINDFSYLVDESSASLDEDKRNIFVKLFLKRKTRKKKPVLEFVDDILNHHLSTYSRLNESQQISTASSFNGKDIPLQCLDAKALLARTTMSTPVSSLDLEWEHETLPISVVHDPSGGSWTILPEDVSDHGESVSSPQVVNNTESDWSRVSSTNSLEWDNVPTSLHDSPPASEMDADTQFLLSEIERLTSQTLRETGTTLFS